MRSIEIHCKVPQENFDEIKFNLRQFYCHIPIKRYFYITEIVNPIEFKLDRENGTFDLIAYPTSDLEVRYFAQWLKFAGFLFSSASEATMVLYDTNGMPERCMRYAASNGFYGFKKCNPPIKHRPGLMLCGLQIPDGRNIPIEIPDGREGKKYILSDETMEWRGHTLHRVLQSSLEGGDDRVRFSKDFIMRCGWIESEANLSQNGSCGVWNQAKVYGNARVYGDAQINGHAEVYDNARVFGISCVCENAFVHGDTDVCQNAVIKGNAEICGTASIMGLKTYIGRNKTVSAGVFYTGGTYDDFYY